MTLFIAFILLYSFQYSGLWYVAAVIVYGLSWWVRMEQYSKPTVNPEWLQSALNQMHNEQKQAIRDVEYRLAEKMKSHDKTISDAAEICRDAADAVRRLKYRL